MGAGTVGVLMVLNLFRIFLWASFTLMVNWEIAVLAQPLGVECSIWVLALEGLLGPTLGVVAVFAHTVGIVGLSCMGTFGNILSVFLFLDSLSLAKLFIIIFLLRRIVCWVNDLDWLQGVHALNRFVLIGNWSRDNAVLYYAGFHFHEVNRFH